MFFQWVSLNKESIGKISSCTKFINIFIGGSSIILSDINQKYLRNMLVPRMSQHSHSSSSSLTGLTIYSEVLYGNMNIYCSSSRNGGLSHTVHERRIYWSCRRFGCLNVRSFSWSSLAGLAFLGVVISKPKKYESGLKISLHFRLKSLFIFWPLYEYPARMCQCEFTGFTFFRCSK